MTAQQWARLDPSNAAPWLAMAAEAERRGDADTLGDAMFHVATAERDEQGWGRLPGLLIDHAPPGDNFLTGTLMLAIEGFGIDAASTTAHATAMKYCSASNLADANRRESCESMAALLVDHSDTLLVRRMGAALGRRLGWSPERMRSIEEERNALYEMTLRAGPLEIDTSTRCKEIRRGLDRIREMAAYGEVGSTRRSIAASGQTGPGLAADYQRAAAEKQENARKEEAAASVSSAAASAASSADTDRSGN
jgi:hypothetical protein